MKVKSKKSVCIQASPSAATVDDAIDRLFNEISPLITAARERVAVGVNTELTKLNWNVGNCINREILGCSRAEYGNNGICHDRFHIIDDKELYMIGASLKDLGRKCFGFTKMDAARLTTSKGRRLHLAGEREPPALS